MRVLMLSWEYPPHVVGGLGKHVAELVPALLQLPGVSVDVITPRWRGGAPEEALGTNGRLLRVGGLSEDPDNFYNTVVGVNPRLEEKARDIVSVDGPYDVIHAHDWLVAFAADSLKHGYRTPLISTIHATEKGRVRGELQTELQRSIHGIEWWLTFESWRIITTSRYMADQVRDHFNLPADKMDVIPNGVDTGRFDRLEGVDLAEFRRRYAEPPEKIVFFVGRLVWEKGIQVLVRAAPLVLQEMPAVTFVVAGTGPQMEALEALAESSGVSSRFRFTGFIPDEDRDKLFKVSDVGVFPSLYEPFGIVALEAMAAKLPIVVSDTGGLSEVVADDETGTKVLPDNPESLARGILRTLENPGSTRNRAANAYRVVRTVYNWSKIAGDTLAVYRRVRAEYLESDWSK